LHDLFREADYDPLQAAFGDAAPGA
jgi:hypothetical protein